MNNLNIIIAGLGNVGSSLISFIESEKNYIEQRLNRKIIISGICAKNKNKKRTFLTKNYKWFDSPITMINETESNIYIELMGYEKGISYDSIKLAIDKKINVITANKALIANYGNEIFELAENNNVNIFFEAAVAGGIPIIKTIKSLLIGNDITKISGILNGTTNYILSKMTLNKVSFKESLDQAKKDGYVESNPDLDLEGIDSAHKLSILTSLAFGVKFVKFSSIYTDGITSIDTIDIDFANKLNFVIKLLSVVEFKDSKLIQFVKPMMISNNSQLGQVNDVLNGIQITTKNSGKIFLEGLGAGGKATASSIISDIGEYCNNPSLASFGLKFDLLKVINSERIEEQYSSFYIRLVVIDKPGVLAEITSLFKENNISIESMIQDPDKNETKSNYLPLMFITHKTYQKNIDNCIKKIINMESVKDKPVVIQIYKV